MLATCAAVAIVSAAGDGGREGHAGELSAALVSPVQLP